MTKRILKFNGRYRDLKGKGFVFQKLFASNYMQWCKDLFCGHYVRVWKKGNDVEIDDYYALSGAVAEFIRDHVEVSEEMLYLVIDLKNNKVIPFEQYRYESYCYGLRDMGTVRPEIEEVMIPGLSQVAFHEHFRVVHMTPEIVEYIKELWKDDMIRIEGN